MRNVARGVCAAVIAVLVANASATVTQVDGTIVPELSGMQAALDTYEQPAGTLDAIEDAREAPEIFRPRTSSAVVFLDMREGAGFENSFGWYNVGDDVVTAAGRAANLHPVMGCGIPMNTVGGASTHLGIAAHYAQNAEEGTTAMVDFAAEQAAGRYKGGFIGFYLITPEDPANPGSRYGDRMNCGDFKVDPNNGRSLLGRIYFTQKDLNDDGDFVHHLVYTSTIANRYLFGFEDLFRGGDNDYEDMAMRIDGLTPPCVPQAEVCDSIDNDCDGLVDAADPDLGGVGDACQCDGVGLTCSNGPRFGVCRNGVTACVAGGIVCTGTGTASAETCNGLDDNCNNVVDDNPSGTGASCDGADADQCPEGQIVCSNGMLVCGDNTGPNVELCNNMDDDCDGATDEGNPGAGGSCGSSIGVCTPGTFQCIGGTLQCQGGNQGGAEICNNLDDDCDGVIDDSPSGVGAQCGATNAGVCEFGMTVCAGGTLQCSGQIGPTVEVCNDLDDDCDGTRDDNPVDAGQPCGSSIGACEPGAFACMFGTLVCTGGIGPAAEICNGIDDDCNGVVDDNVPGEGEMCGVGGGTCSNGMTKCIDGSMQCVGGAGNGTEVCNNIDDDCDGTIDEGDLCTGGVCDNGTCAGPCVAGEFPCPTGKKCENNFCVDDPCFNVNCPIDANGNLQTCQEGVCVELCPTISCPTGLVCRGTDGACVPDTCEWLPKCADNELCIASTCQPNPCKDVTCPDGEFCREGACVGSCQGVQCGGGQVCRDGACVASGCPTCATDQVCDPELGVCVDDQCGGVQCPPLQVCNPVDGSCVPDPCVGVACPSGQTCSMGQCGESASGSLVTTGGGGGCAAGGGEGSILVALAALGLVLRRRRGVRVLALIAAASLSSAGCEVNDYCLGCDILPDDAGPGGNGDGGDGGDGGNNVSCDPMNVRPETCNNADDDCDGVVDETIDLQNDEMNCGACGTQCNKPGAQTKCETGACNILGCFPGFNDENGDITGPYAGSDGCEYVCFQSNGGTEACDGLDNDCDGDTDEGFAVQNDVNNCGACGRRCEFFEATPTCSAGTCSFNPATACSPGFHDINMMQADGCEYSCTTSNGGTEACDVRDNDCDGRVDETFNFMMDRFNCGRCGLVCAFPNVTPRCVAGMCGYNPATDCMPGFRDIDGQPANGCEYACTPSNGGIERCDGVDNDCDGVADDSPTDAGGPCSATTPATGVCVANGVRTCTAGQLRCVGATQPSTEVCDNLDNDCDGPRDESVARSCYTGPNGTLGVGRCTAGTETCTTGVFGTCMGQVTPTTEICNGLDDDCDAVIDDGPGGMPITQTCYTGAAGTAGVGTCKSGTATCTFGAPGTCVGQVVPRAEVCGDTLDSDCDALNDTQEGCQVTDDELRLDATGAVHSYDLVLTRGGDPFGGRVYAVWSENVGSTTEVFLRRSVDGGQTWLASINLTESVSESAVKPQIAVAPGNPDRVIVAYQTVTSSLVRDIRVQVSTNSGISFGAASAVLDSSGDSFHHSVAIRGLNVVVAWERLNTATLYRDIISRTSTDGGATWGVERTINTSTNSFAGRPQVGITFNASTSTTRVIYVWREVRGTATRNVYAASVALGDAPATNARLDNDTGDNRDSDFPRLVVNEAAAYVVWQDVSTVAGGGADAMFVRTTNQGTSWSAERIIDDPTNEVSSSFTPAIAVDPRAAGTADDVVAIAWEDRRQGTQIYASRSLDGGATFAAPVRASNETGDPISGETTVPQIAASGSGVLTVVYQNKLPMAARSHVFIATSIDNGATWTHTHEQLDGGAGNAIFPQVVASVVGASNQASAVAGWTDFRGDGVNGAIYIAVSR